MLSGFLASRWRGSPGLSRYRDKQNKTFGTRILVKLKSLIGFYPLNSPTQQLKEYLWTLERNLDGMPELTHYTETGRQAHSSMNNISHLMQHTLEVTDLGAGPGNYCCTILPISVQISLYDENDHIYLYKWDFNIHRELSLLIC